MKSLAIITARGGSKRIPRKNIKKFCGKPMMVYSIDAALTSAIFDTVMVSTDDEEVADIARKAGAEVPFFRSSRTSGDHATTRDVLEEVLEFYAGKGCKYGEMCCLYPTAPFVTAEKLREAHQLLQDPKTDSVIPVVEFSYPPQRAFILKGGKLQYQYPQYSNSRSQDLEPIFHDCGQFYFYKLSEDMTFSCKNTAPFFVPETEVQDIDNESDWEIAEMKFKLMQGRKKERR